MAQKHSPGLPIPQDWDGLSWCQFSICWPDSLQWRAILAGFITTPMLGRTWDGDTGTIVDAQAIGQQIFENNLDWRYCLVASCDQGVELSAAIRYLADKLLSAGCCTAATPGSYVQGTLPESGYPFYGSQAPGEVDPEHITPPDGFASWEDYENYKCRVANHLFDGIIGSLDNLSLLSIVNLVGGGLSLAALFGIGVVVPPAAIAILTATLIGLGLGLSYLADLKDWFVTNRDDIVCSLYLSDDATSAYTAFAGYVDEAIAAIAIPSAVSPAVRTVALLLASTDTLNNLFNLTLDIAYADADCSFCNETAVYWIKVTYEHNGNIEWVPWDGENNFEVTKAYQVHTNYKAITFQVFEQDHTTNACIYLQKTADSGGYLASSDAGVTYCDGTYANVSHSGRYQARNIAYFSASIGGTGNVTVEFDVDA